MATKLEEIGRQVFLNAERDLTQQDCFDLVREIHTWRFGPGTDDTLLAGTKLNGTRVELKLTREYLNVEVLADRKDHKGTPYSLYHKKLEGRFQSEYEELNIALATVII